MEGENPKETPETIANKPTQETAQTQPAQAEPKKLSKKQLKKLEKQRKKEEKRIAREKAELEARLAKIKADEESDPLNANYTDAELVQSQGQTEGKVWTSLKDIAAYPQEYKDKELLVRGRVHAGNKTSSSLAFIILREGYNTLQTVASVGEHISKPMINWIKRLPNESIVDITGKLVEPKDPIQACSIKLEVEIYKIVVIDRSIIKLPLLMKDACRKLEIGEVEEDEPLTGCEEHKEEPKQGQGKKSQKVTMFTRLQNRVLDMRTPANHAIYRLNSAVCQLFRTYLYSQDFIEIHTPKLIGGVSEGGTEVFRLKYFGQDACLAQSPQLYKQMAIMGDLGRVFEIGPVFRAEKSFTNRHLTEFVGLDLEMAIKEHYFEVLDVIGNLFLSIFKGLEGKYSNLLDAISEQFPFEPFLCPDEIIKITYEEGVKWLNDAGVEQDPKEDLSKEAELALGAIVREKFKSDFYILHRYPKNARPFYTMLCADDPEWTCSYDIFMRGEEITSGAQRVHDIEMLKMRATQCEIPLSTLKDYISSFQYGAFPHGGCGIGLERVVMLYADLKTVKKTSMFPRTPNRLFP